MPVSSPFYIIPGDEFDNAFVAKIRPYPPQADALQQASSEYLAGLMKPFIQKILKIWLAWRR